MPSQSPLFASVVSDPELMAELQSRMKKSHSAQAETLESMGLELPLGGLRAVVEGKMAESAEAQSFAEAIVLLDGRPSLLVTNDQFAEPDTNYWKTRLNPHREAMKRVIQSVGRVELTGHPSFEWVGTGWVIGERLIATNRHVAMVFAQRGGAGFAFRQGQGGGAMTARLDFREEFGGSGEKQVGVRRVLYMAPDTPGQPDMAVLELTDTVGSPPPLALAERSRTRGAVAAIGYPAHDSRNGADAMHKVFGEIFDVKRFAPGFLMPDADANTLRHNCSTLGGNSGSAVVDVASGRVIGLHFGGQFKTANYAVKAEVIRGVLAGLQTGRTSFVGAGEGESEATVASLASREGYKADFLGSGKRVKLPDLTADQQEDAVPVNGGSDFVLTYTHFSVALCASRRMCYYAAVNIDGSQSINLRRTGSWAFDPRIPASAQAGNDLYAGNKLDRGHMVRRLDPVWGTQAAGKQANADTFFFTNSCPQVDRLNQGIWNDLEDYLLNNANEQNFKASVFTGPVFHESDREYRGFRLPQDFWKVAVMVKANGKLSATAYMLTQKHLLGGLEEGPAGFVFGAYRTYQVPVARVERLTGLSFGNLSTFDPLFGQEGVGEADAREVRGPDDLVL